MATISDPTATVMALDVGSKRVGLALASLAAKLPQPLTTLERNDRFYEQLETIVKKHNVTRLVVGLPRGLSGQQTAQTEATEEFVGQLRSRLSVPVELQDEALTSRQAREELEGRGRPYAKADIDALAATYILEDWLQGKSEAVPS